MDYHINVQEKVFDILGISVQGGSGDTRMFFRSTISGAVRVFFEDNPYGSPVLDIYLDDWHWFPVFKAVRCDGNTQIWQVARLVYDEATEKKLAKAKARTEYIR